MDAYEEMVRNTATPSAPWYVVPADKKWFTRLVVADAVAEALEEMGSDYPKFAADRPGQMAKFRAILEAGDD